MKTKLNPINLLFIIVIATLNSCSPVYLPTTINAPLFKEKGDAHAGVNVAVSGTHLSAAYAITDNIAISGDVTIRTNVDDPTSDIDITTQQIFNGGVGAFKCFDNGFLVGVMGGAGAGNVQNFDWNQNDRINNSLTKLYISPYIGNVHDIIGFSLGTRFSYVDIRSRQQQATGYFFEPFISGEVGYKYVKMYIQIGLSGQISGANTIDYNPFMLNIGLKGSLNIIESFKLGKK